MLNAVISHTIIIPHRHTSRHNAELYTVDYEIQDSFSPTTLQVFCPRIVSLAVEKKKRKTINIMTYIVHNK